MADPRRPALHRHRRRAGRAQRAEAVRLHLLGIYSPTTPEEAKTSLVLRVHGDPGAARRTLLDELTKVDPALGEITTMKMMAGLDKAVLGVAFWMAVILGSLALALTVSGLFSVLSYLVEQRRAEIGVRMALGATPRDILTLVLSQSMRPIAAGALAGGGLAAGVATVLLATPLAEMIGTFVRPFDPLAYAAGLGTIVATCLVAALLPARRAARINPIATLRAESSSGFQTAEDHDVTTTRVRHRRHAGRLTPGGTPRPLAGAGPVRRPDGHRHPARRHAGPDRQPQHLRPFRGAPGPRHLRGHLGGAGRRRIPNTRGIRNDVVAALKALDMPVLRWPGGCFADEYHWKDGIGPRDKRPVHDQHALGRRGRGQQLRHPRVHGPRGAARHRALTSPATSAAARRRR